MICAVCETIGFFSSGLCLRCLSYVRRVKFNDESAEILKCIFYYEGIAKDLILSAKIRHDRNCIKLLCLLFKRSQLVERACQRNDLILVAPSSLWSRFHGRLDLAYALANDISKAFTIPVFTTPRTFGWHFRKQAHRKNRTLIPHRNLIKFPQKRVLLIDDIRTSGQTLRTLENSLEAASFESITLARTKNSDEG